jgi:hypothetical protein
MVSSPLSKQAGEDTMNVGDPVSTPPSLVDRVKGILLTPKEEWPKIEAEPATIGGIYTSYVLILAAIPAVAFAIGMLGFGMPFFGRPPMAFVLSTAITQYVMGLVAVFVVSLIIDWLAPTFGGVKSQINAFKVAAYSYTASWVAGIFLIIPSLAILGILAGLYSFYLLYLGLPVLMKAPADKAVSYTVVTIIAAIVLSIVVAAVTAPVAGLFGGSLYSTPTLGKVDIPGGGSVDLGKLEQAAKEMEANAKRMELAAKTGASAGVAPTALQGLLPETIGGYRRTSIESQSMGAAGVGGSQAEARYEAGDNNFRLSVTDMAAMGGLAAMGAALNVQSNKQTEDGYEKTNTIDGRLVNEKWHNDGNGEFGMLVKNRFMVQAEGKVASIDELKGAVAAVGIGKLESMAN